ncbi:hypothetical protein [Actinoplanes sp. NBRC 101535]|uniref:NucA/NucB deoxyribonuclease domain-containing protein n=1 Tax=Actinoplanes sp. NBRC 101535 TaxID=3032196 RepID=UPI0025568268|nr:hypothetical protein [Actinoplanes sp. NBRC 101535]
MTFRRTLRATALTVAILLPLTAVVQPAAAATGEPPPACTDRDVNHPSIQLDGPRDGTTLAVDKHGQIDLRGSLRRHAEMIDVAVDRASTTDFRYDPDPHLDSTGDDVSWSARLRPAHLGASVLCARAEGDHRKYAKITRTVKVVDLIPPSNVTGLAVSAITATGAKATWEAATDNYGLAGYDVSVDGGAPQRTTVGTRAYTIDGLEPSSTHTVAVVAVDLAGNRSKTAATTSFTTTAAPADPDPDADLTFDPEQGGATATWAAAPDTEASYRVYLDGLLYDEFTADHFCDSPCTTVDYPVEPLEEYTLYAFSVEALAADGTVVRELEGTFTTMINVDEVPVSAVQLSASEASQCASNGGDFYIAADTRDIVTVPAGSTLLFAGCYTAGDSSCVDDFLPPSGDRVLDCTDNVTQLLYGAAPTGRGPVIASLPTSTGIGAKLAPAPVVPVTWCTATACTMLLSPPAQAVKLVTAAPVAAAGTSWVVVAAAGIGIGLALWALLEILFPGEIGILGLLEYPISHDVDFDTFDNWAADEGEWYNSLKVYAEVVKTTKLLTVDHNLAFAWDSAEDARLKRIIDAACTAQRGTQGTAGCDDDLAVYVPGGTNYQLRPMKETGTHIVVALGDGSYPQPPTRAVWFYPGRSLKGQKATAAGHTRSWYDTEAAYIPNTCTGRVAGKTCDEFPFWTTDQAVDLSGQVASLQPVPTTESLPQASDLSAFYRKCDVDDGDKFIVLPVKPWVAANGPSFGFRVSQGGASLCMTPQAPGAP